MEHNLIYLDTYVLQQDMRVRMPKCVLENMKLQKGKSRLKIYLDKNNDCLVLMKDKSEGETDEK